ncbi:MAG TPA: hypothetical protein VF703_02345 [Pyrinomonadaceae bacterium]|jgi:hypothetical protein
MKKLQNLFATVVLTLMLSASALALDGIISPMRTEPTPTPAPVMATSNEAEAECVTNMSEATDSVTEVVLSLLPSVLALF